MALDATIGAATSNSFVSRQYADDYFQLGVHPAAERWHTLHDETKDSLLVEATRQINRLKLLGSKRDTGLTSGVPDQALKFPRTTDYDDGTEYIPVGVSQATCEQGLHLWQSGGGGDNVRAQLQAAGVTSATIRNISETYSTRGGLTALDMIGPEARALLDDAGVLIKYGRVV